MKRLGTARGEEGSALVLALLFLSLFGALISVLLSFGDTSLRGTLAVRDEASAAYAADGAVQGAINRIRGDINSGRSGDDFTCFSPPSINSIAVSVRCQGQSGSGAITGTNGDNANNKPAGALLSLATGEDGITQGSGANLLVHGAIGSNSTIKVPNASATLTVQGSVTARGACDSARITSTAPPLSCNYGAGANSALNDPNYTSAVASAPAYQAVPACGASWLVQFAPGTYDDAVALTALMNGGTCAGKVFYFAPGSYYFDFRKTGVSHVWTISDAALNLVGGTPNGWSTGAGSRPAISIPGGCDTTASGVQFIFGGDSQWNVAAGKVELCPDPNTSSQRIAVFGLKSGSSSATNGSLTPSTASSTTFTPAANGTTINSSSATASLSSSTTSASLTDSAYSNPIPAGALINSVTLRVAHLESSLTQLNGLSVTVTPGSGGSPQTFSSSACGTANALTMCTAMHTDSIPLTVAGSLDAYNRFTGMTVAYTATRKNSSPTDSLDGIELSVNYTPVAFEAESGCIVNRPYAGNASACAVLKTSGSPTVVLNGTVYAPLAPVDATIGSVGSMVFRRGIIAWTINLALTPAAGVTSALVQTPDDSGTRADRQVLLTATESGTTWARSLVTFTDGGGSTPGATVTVNSWSVTH